MVDHLVDASGPRGRIGVGRRRRWSEEAKGRIVAESYARRGRVGGGAPARGADSLAALAREALGSRSGLGNDLHLPVAASGPPEDPDLERGRAGAAVEAA